MDKFDRDVFHVYHRLKLGLDEEQQLRLKRVRRKLIRIHRRGLVKINHSLMELVCAKALILEDYSVDVEHPVGENLVCDVYGEKGEGSFIVEIETGYIPPDHAIDPQTFWSARVASKIARYSAYAGRFALASPPTNIIPIARLFLLPPRDRVREDVMALKGLCDVYYSSPPVTFDEILSAKLHTVLLIDVDEARVVVVSPDEYVYATEQLRQLSSRNETR